ncbi:MAG TPA: CheR family methyltransferase [Rubrobacteraceae bacterium]|nr:CheR family methyltransferase [Rubrobacteraceae bacterium]
MTESRTYSHLVVVGSSAGGVEALSVLVSTLPPDFSAPVVIAQHLDPHRESHLGEILARKSTLPVRTVTDHEPLEAGVVFVVPANRHVNVTDSEIDLRVDPSGRPKPSIDLLLGSAAEVIGERLIAIILTGTGSDGAAGAAAVKKAGGTVIIQNPRTAQYPGMPLSLAPNTVDIISELDRIGPILQDLLASVRAPSEPGEQEALRTLLEEVRERNGIDFSSYKTPTIMRRLQRRIVATGSGNIEGYNEYLEENPEEYQQLVSSFLINVTEFFRDAELFDHLKTEMLPRLIEESRNRGNQLRLWSAGCATGEEAYSLAILMAEALGDELGRFKVRIFATDIDEEAIAFARRGIYSHSALAGVSEDLINRYFVKDDGDYQVNKLIRGMVIFGQHDLAQRAPFPNTDMVICRNVLIYFTTALQKRALQLFAYSLRDDGRLVLGKAESTSPLSEFFVPEDRQRKIYRRRGDRFLMPPALLESPVPISPKKSPSPGENTARIPGPVQQAGRDQQQADRLLNNLLLKLPVGMVAVDRRYDIQFINNVARRLLSIHSPATGEDLIHLVQGAAYTTLRSAIDAAFREDDPVEVDELAVEEPDTGEFRYLRMVIRAQSTSDAREPSKTVMIFIQDITNLARTRSDLAQRLQSVTAELEQEKSLNERLAQTNRQLDEGNQELTRVNEDLQTANEELLLSTEEAQAATEEVETLNEELQSTNEELETLNEELQATIEELNTTTDDLQARSMELQSLARDSEREQARLEAILDSMDTAVLVVDAAGQDAFANAAYQRMFGERGLVCLDESGEPLPPDEVPRHRATREELFNMEFLAETRDGARRRFEATGGPLRDDEDGRQGGVIHIRDVKERG